MWNLKQDITQIGNSLSKRDKLGIHSRVEKIALEAMSSIIRATFSSKNEKLPFLEKSRLSLEVLKHLARTEYEMNIIPEKAYIRIECHIIETSKMTNGWIKYLAQSPRD